jgi:hypothetical protein
MPPIVFYVTEYQNYVVKKCCKVSEYPCMYITMGLYARCNRWDLATIIKYITNYIYHSKTVKMMSDSMQRAMALCHHSTYLHYLDGVPLCAITPLRCTLWLTSGEASADSVLESSSNTASAAKKKLTGYLFLMV